MLTETNEDRQRSMKLLSDLAVKANTCDYIFSGENENYGQIKSSLYLEYTRKYPLVLDHMTVAEIQEIELSIANQHSRDVETDLHLLHMLQHHRGKTNLIDFTDDYLIALFFACDGKPGKDGRVILLHRNQHLDKITKPDHPCNRVIAQKSVFVEPPSGYLTTDAFEQQPISKELKQHLLQILRNNHGITGPTIYNDLHGYVTRRSTSMRTLQTVAEGRTLQQHGEYQGAIAKFTEAIQANPDNPAAFLYRAQAHHHLGQMDDAIDDNTDAIKIYPRMKDAYNNRGVAHAAKGNTEQAFADYNRALEIDPNFADAHNNRGVLRYRMRNLPAAIQDFNRAIECAPTMAIAYCNRGQARIETDGSEPALADFTEAILHDPEYATAYYNRGILRRERGQPGADEDLAKAYDLDPSLR